MKTYTYSLLLAAAATGMAFGQTAYTTPVGYTTQALAANTFNAVGLNILNPAVVSSVLTGVSGTTLSDSTQNFGTLLTAGKTYIVEITSGTTTTPATAGTAAGGVEWFTTWTGSSFTVPSSENVAGVAVGDKYTIRLAPTLQTLFPSGLTPFGLANVAGADKVWVPQGNGTYIRYAVKTGANAGWHTTPDGNTDGGLVTGDIPIYTGDALLVEKKGVVGSLTLSGEVKKTPSSFYAVQGFNLASITPPAGATLFTSGLNGDLTPFGLANVAGADKIWVPQGNGTYIRYAVKTGANAGWHVTPDGNTDGGLVAVDVPLPSSIYIQKATATPKLITFDVPASYSNL